MCVCSVIPHSLRMRLPHCTIFLHIMTNVACMGEERWVYRGKPEGKRPLGRPRRRWVDNIRMDLQEVGCGYMDWNGLAQDGDRWRTLVSAVMNLLVPWNAGNFLTSCKPVSCARRTLHRGVRKYYDKRHYSRKCMFWLSPQLLSDTFLILRRTARNVIKNVYSSSCKYPTFSLDFNDPEFSPELFHGDGRTDGETGRS